MLRNSWLFIQNIIKQRFWIRKNKFNLINCKLDIDKIYLYAKDLYEEKHQLFINKTSSTGLKFLNDSKAFIEYLDNICLVIFTKILKNAIQIINNIADMHDEKTQWIVTDLFY